jgi:hypothetical protein
MQRCSCSSTTRPAACENKHLGTALLLSATSSFFASPSVAAMLRAAAISTTLVCLKSVEPFYEPSGPTPLGQHGSSVSIAVPRASVGRCMSGPIVITAMAENLSLAACPCAHTGTCHAWACLQHKMYVNREALRPVHDLNMSIAIPGWILLVFKSKDSFDLRMRVLHRTEPIGNVQH